MSGLSHIRGNEIVMNWETGAWHYASDGALADHDRPCPRCGLMPTPEGYDACLGFIPGIDSACCGHGIDEGYTNKLVNGEWEWKGE